MRPDFVCSAPPLSDEAADAAGSSSFFWRFCATGAATVAADDDGRFCAAGAAVADEDDDEDEDEDDDEAAGGLGGAALAGGTLAGAGGFGSPKRKSHSNFPSASLRFWDDITANDVGRTLENGGGLRGTNAALLRTVAMNNTLAKSMQSVGEALFPYTIPTVRRTHRI